MKKIGVVGAGTMGSGIAQKAAMEGFTVTVVDLDEAALQKSRQRMEEIFSESIQRRLLRDEDVAKVWGRIRFSTRLTNLAESDLVIEAIFEDLDAKMALFRQLSEILSPDAVIATNTSTFPVTDLARSVSRPERFVGLHFFYHPVKNRLLEIIPGDKTDPGIVERARQFCQALGKVDLLCKDRPGFVVNRFFVPWLNEAVRLLAEGRATLEEIEHTARSGFGIGMGPFELMNVTGVPIAARAAAGLERYLGEFYRPHERLIRQAQEGPWPLEKKEDVSFRQEVFDRLFGVVIFLANQLLEENACTAEGVEIGAKVGLRWPRGPLGMWNAMSEKDRARVLGTFRSAYSGLSLPRFLKPERHYPIRTVELEIKDDTATFFLSRPDQANALNEQVFADLEGFLKELRGISTLVIRGRGKNFAAGADIKFFLDQIREGTIDRIVDFTARAQQVLLQLDRFDGRVVAVVDGFALGGGAELALSADFIVVTPRARIGFPETGIGIYPGLGGTCRLTRRVGKGLARYLIGTGAILTGDEAAEIGWADACVHPIDLSTDLIRHLQTQRKQGPGQHWQNLATFMESHSLGDLLSGTFPEEWQQKIQKKLKQKAPLALATAFELIDANVTADIETAYANELKYLPKIFSTRDALEGLQSVGKYRPKFEGR